MSDNKFTFNQAAEISFDENHWEKLNHNIDKYEKNLAKGLVNYKDLDLEKRRAFLFRNKSLLNLEKLLVDFETRFNANGGTVIWARNSEDAKNSILEIINKENAQKVVKSNSSVLDEIGLDSFLAKKKINTFETSVGRFIMKTGGMKPYHPVTPVIQLSKEDINGLLAAKYKLKPDSTPKQMLNFISKKVCDDLLETEVSISGANFLLSDVGGVVLSENEGNIMKSVAVSKTHIVVAGIDKMLASIDELSLLLPLLSSHGTGQLMSAYNTITMGPSKEKSQTGFYVILLDNGRSKLLSYEKQRLAMSCIHCGACINVCPIYKNVGGDAYGTTYFGPIGSVVTPILNNMKEFGHLSMACSLCGLCSTVCPVNIPIDDLIVANRQIMASQEIGNAKIEFFINKLAKLCKSRKKMDLYPPFMKNVMLKHYLNQSCGNRRTLPKFEGKSFSQLWKEQNK